MARPRKTNTTINGKDYYRLRKTIDGVQKNFYGKSKGDAENKYKMYLEQHIRDSRTSPSQPDTRTFGELARIYITDTLKVSQRYATGTVKSYESRYRNYVEDTWLDKTRVTDITPSLVQKFYNGLDISQSGIKQLNKFMKGLCKWMQLNGYSGDWLSAVEIPKKEDNSRHEGIVIWEDEELAMIFHALDKEEFRYDFLIRFLLYTGVRISEALGMKYSDIYDGSIHVERQYYLQELKEPKWGSRRQIPMHHDLVIRYEEHIKRHKEEMRSMGYETEFIFTTQNGSLYRHTVVWRALNKFYKEHGIPQKNIHCYRSTFCTQMCRCGVPLEVAAKLMGHKSMDVTANHYALVRKETMQDAINKLRFDF